MNRRSFMTATGLVAGNVALGLSTQEKQPMKKILVAADPFAVQLKDAIAAHLKEKGYEVVDLSAVKGKDTPYYDSAAAVGEAMQRKEADRAILFCGTGMGMSIVANRYKGCTAAVVESVFAAKMCRAINNANVLCMGQMIWGEFMAKEAVDVFLKTKFTEGLEGFADFLHSACSRVDAIRP